MKTECETWLALPLRWKRSGDAEYPYAIDSDITRLQLRVNDFPVEQMYTLFVNGREVGSFDDWPESWNRGE